MLQLNKKCFFKRVISLLFVTTCCFLFVACSSSSLYHQNFSHISLEKAEQLLHEMHVPVEHQGNQITIKVPQTAVFYAGVTQVNDQSAQLQVIKAMLYHYRILSLSVTLRGASSGVCARHCQYLRATHLSHYLSSQGLDARLIFERSLRAAHANIPLVIFHITVVPKHTIYQLKQGGHNE